MQKNDGYSLPALAAFLLALLVGAMTLAGCGGGGGGAGGGGSISGGPPPFATYGGAVIGQTDSQGVALVNAVEDAGGSNDTNPYSLQDPRGMAADPTGFRLFVADRSNNRLLVFTLDPTTKNFLSRRAISVLGQADFEHDDPNRGGSVTSSTSDLPDGVAYFNDINNSKEWLLVTEKNNHRVMIYDITTGITDGMAATVVLGQPDFTSNGINRGAGNSGCTPPGIDGGTLAFPRGVLAASVGARDWVFVADTNSNRVLAWDVTTGGIAGLSNGQAADYVIGQPDMATRSSNRCGSANNNTLDDPVGLALRGNTLIVSDHFNDRVVGFDLGTDVDTLVAATLPGGISATWVLGQTDFLGAASGLSDTQMSKPGGVSVDGNHLFVADSFNNRVLVFDLATVTNGEPAVDVIGQADFITGTAATTGTGLSDPWGLAWVGNRLYVSEEGNDRILAIDITSPANIPVGNFPPATDILGQTNWVPGMTAGAEIGIFTVGGSNDTGATGLYDPYDAALGTVSGTQYLFVADNTNQRVLAFETGTDGLPVDLQADVVLGQPDFDSREANATPTATGLGSAKGVAFDQVNGWLFVSDSTHDRVLVWLLSGGITDGMAATFVLGQPNLTSTGANHGGVRDDRGFDGPRHMVIGDVGPDRYLFVADKFNRRVLAFDIGIGVGTYKAAAFVIGQPTISSILGTPSIDGHGHAYGLDYDPARQWLFVAEAHDNLLALSNRVMVYDLSSGITDGMPSSYVLGQPNFDGVNPATSASGMDYPRDVAYDAVNDKLIVADGNNNRLLAFDLSDGISNGEAAVGLNGQPSGTANARDYGASRTALSTGNPSGLFIDPVSGLIYSVQEGEDRIVILSPN